MGANDPKHPPWPSVPFSGRTQIAILTENRTVRRSGRFNFWQHSRSILPIPEAWEWRWAIRNLGSLRMIIYKFQLFSVKCFAVNVAFPFARDFQDIFEATQMLPPKRGASLNPGPRWWGWGVKWIAPGHTLHFQESDANMGLSLQVSDSLHNK